jgi:hypothetical protein
MRDVIAPLLAVALSGLTGLVTRGPITPVCRIDTPCDEPASRVVLAFTNTRGATFTTRTTDTGRYRITLAPGRYRVRTRQPSLFERVPKPSEVVVPRGRYARVNFTIDTGIR